MHAPRTPPHAQNRSMSRPSARFSRLLHALLHAVTPIAHASPPCAPGLAVLYCSHRPRRLLSSHSATASRASVASASLSVQAPEAVDFQQFPGLLLFCRAPAHAACLGRPDMKKERRSPRRPFPVKICENSRPPSRRSCPLSLDFPGFSHALPPCPALSRLSQLSCLSTSSSSINLLLTASFNCKRYPPFLFI